VDSVPLQAAHRLQQDVVEIDAVQRESRIAVALLAWRAASVQRPRLPRVPKLDLALVGRYRTRAHRLFESEAEKHRAAVWGDRDTGADFLQLWGLLIDVNVEAAPQ
jgi:hypothetical protein